LERKTEWISGATGFLCDDERGRYPRNNRGDTKRCDIGGVPLGSVAFRSCEIIRSKKGIRARAQSMRRIGGGFGPSLPVGGVTYLEEIEEKEYKKSLAPIRKIQRERTGKRLAICVTAKRG